MLLPPDSIGECIMFLGCPVCSSGQIFLPQYPMNNLNKFSKTDMKYSLASTDDLIRF